MTLRASCLIAGHCSGPHASVVTDAELQNIHFVHDLLSYAQNLKLKPAEWRAYLTQQYASYDGRILGKDGEEEFLDMDVFEVEDELLFAANDVKGAAQQVTIANAAIREFFDYWLCRPETPKRLPFSEQTRERLRVVATILRAQNPQEAQFWGLSGKAANDNDP